MVFINEWLPNPAGSDLKTEFVELYNDGASSISLDGYALRTEGNKKFLLSGRIISPHGYLLLGRSETKLTLKNSDGGLLLYGPGGDVFDHASFLGSAPEGKSFSRINYGIDASEHFVFSDPTPGAVNKVAFNNSVSVDPHPLGVPLRAASLGGLEILEIAFGLAAALAALILYAIKKDKTSQLFFPRDGEAWL